MPEATPWKGLSYDQARRVDQHGRQDFFWAVVENQAPALALALPDGTEPILPLPKIRSLEIRYRALGAREAFVVALRDQEQVDLFETLCRDIVAAGEQGDDNKDALVRAIRRTLRWHHLLRGGASGRLSLEEQRGLVGELAFLETLIGKIGARAAVEAWKGPEDAAKDFELEDLCVEVKARRGAARPQVQISSVDQLADVEGLHLYLRVYDVDAAVLPNGQTLTDHVRRVDEVFRQVDLEAYAMWESLLVATGFDWDHDYADRRWRVGRVSSFEVGEGFPRLTPPLPTGVVNLKYSIALEACAEFLVEEALMETLIGATPNQTIAKGGA